MTSMAEQKAYQQGFYEIEKERIKEEKELTKIMDKKEKNRTRALKAWVTMRNKKRIIALEEENGNETIKNVLVLKLNDKKVGLINKITSFKKNLDEIIDDLIFILKT